MTIRCQDHKENKLRHHFHLNDCSYSNHSDGNLSGSKGPIELSLTGLIKHEQWKTAIWTVCSVSLVNSSSIEFKGCKCSYFIKLCEVSVQYFSKVLVNNFFLLPTILTISKYMRPAKIHLKPKKTKILRN